jgi:nucleoside-diphosphate-sugar epimerase
MSAPIATVFGASGGMGHSLVKELIGAGYHVRAVARNGLRLQQQFGNLPVEICPGDAADRAFVRRMCDGAELVFHSVGLPYPEWDAKQMPIMNAILQGASGVAKRLILVHPVYAYGHPETPVVSETHPTNPQTKKGKIRREMEKMLEEAHNKGEIEGIIARFPDFYGPYADNSFLHSVLRSFVEKKTVYWVGPLDVEREYIFMPDAAKALVQLAQKDHAAGQAWNIPGGSKVTGSQVIQYASEILGYEPKVVSVKKWMLRLLGIGDKTMREIVEMYYLFDRPFFLDGSKYQTQIGEIPHTPFKEGLIKTLEWMKGH